jgi:anti-sigma B factor antagonist
MVRNDGTSPATFEVVAGPDDGTVTLKVGGEIDVATSPGLRRELYALLEDDPEQIVVDLSATTFVDSSGLGVFVGLLKRLRETDPDRTLVLASMQDPVRKVFEITGLTELFRIEG